MNLEEAKANIGKEVVLDESTKPYTFIRHLGGIIKKWSQPNDDQVFTIHNTEEIGNVLVRGTDDHRIHPRHLKLKEQPMNYKIRVTPETSKEVQELFFELGYGWRDNGKKVFRSEDVDVIYSKEDYIFYRSNTDPVPENYDGYKKITLPQPRDMVVLKRNSFIYGSVQDAVNAFQKSIENKEDLQMAWQDALGAVADGKYLKPKEPNMTWQDALRAVADGREVEYYAHGATNAWCSVKGQNLYFLIDERMEFRLVQQITLNGNYTKEELLKIAGEME